MSKVRKSEVEAEAIGAWIRSTRESHGFTIEDVQGVTTVNVGQISRFERGQFVFVTENLQKIIDFLQNADAPRERHPHLMDRFAALLDRSPRHQAAAMALIGALEGLQ